MSAATLTSDKVVSMHATPSAVPAPAANEAAAPVAKAAPREPRTPISEILLAVFKAVFPPIAGMALLVAVWALLAAKGGSIPGPLAVWDAAKVLFADPFYNNGPNDMGIGWNVLSSLQRVGIGFGFAAFSVGIAAITGPARYNRAKQEAYECGIEPSPQALEGGRFPVKYFLTAMLFIVFDIEIVFLYPWAVSFDALGLFGLVEMGIFIATVFVAYAYVWRRGGLEWD